MDYPVGGRFYVDTEGNSFVPSKFHCAVAKSLSGDEVVRFTPETVHHVPAFINAQRLCIGHNFINWDLPNLERVFNTRINRDIIKDSLVLSRLGNSRRGLDPRDLRHPDPVLRKKPHSIEAWGVRFGLPKPEIESWDEYTPEMLARCERDVDIGILTLRYIMKKELGYIT